MCGAFTIGGNLLSLGYKMNRKTKNTPCSVVVMKKYAVHPCFPCHSYFFYQMSAKRKALITMASLQAVAVSSPVMLYSRLQFHACRPVGHVLIFKENEDISPYASKI